MGNESLKLTLAKARPMLMICAILRAYMGQSGRSSGVERNLAKVEVVGSNPIARSSFFDGLGHIFPDRLIDTPLYPHKLALQISSERCLICFN